ncbi:MAG: LacI family transcriptional regulator, partial [Firmicutes bacterium]|nr:LacI family transcriptional regulator [Bacillota bacterium]
ERDFVKFLYDHTIAGLILIFPQMSDEEIVKLKSDGQHIVLFGRNMQQYKIPSITVDNKMGAYNAVLHLFSHGYTRIAFIGGVEHGHLGDRKERLEGYKQAIVDGALTLRPEYIEDGAYFEETACSAFMRLMRLPEPPDAVFCGNDEMALGVLKAAKQLGIKIPEQVGLIGFDNIRICQYTSPTLTTVNQPTYIIGNLCCEKLIYSLNNRDREGVFTNLLLKPDLVIRESCGC